MADSVAHLRDCVFPSIPVRQWVFTLPKRLRFLLAWRPKLISLMLGLFLRTLFAWQRRCAQEQGIAAPLCGAVSFIQRFGSLLNLNLHAHTLVPDGVFFEDEHTKVQFHPLLPPTRRDLEELIRKLVHRLLRKLGEEELPEQAEWMLLLCQTLASGSVAQASEPPRGLGVFCEGFSLHAASRSAIYAAPGAPRLVRLSPMQFMGRLAALIPPPRSHLTRFHGIFAPHSKHRGRIVPAPLETATPASQEQVPPAAAGAAPGNNSCRLPSRSPRRVEDPIGCPGPRCCAGSSPSTYSPAIAAAASAGWWRF